jgi:hypothetical protein
MLTEQRKDCAMSYLNDLAHLSYKENTVNICTTLFWRLSNLGLTPEEINKLVKDVFNMLKDGGSFTVSFVNYELRMMGWEKQVIDECSFELIILLLENEFDYSVYSHVIH